MIKRITALLLAAVLMKGCTEIEESVLEENTAIAEEEIVEQVEENNEATSTDEEKAEETSEVGKEESEPEVVEEIEIAAEIILQDDSERLMELGRYYSDEAKVPGVEHDELDEGHVIADSLGGYRTLFEQNL